MIHDTLVGDLDHIDFGGEPMAVPFLEAARRLAAAIDIQAPGQRGAAASAAAAAAAIEGIGLADVLPQLDPDTEAVPLLFELGQLFGHANPGAGWRGMSTAAAALLGAPAGVTQVAVPAGPQRWILWLARDAAAPAAGLYWIEADGARLRGPLAPDAGCRQHGLCGMPWAGAMLLAHGAARPDSPAQPLAPGAWQRYCAAQRALLSGLMAGGCRRLRQEAYAYAKLRRSAGKPIAQLQAVALRLANLALAEQALVLYAAAAAKPTHRRDAVTAIDTLDVAYFNDCVFDVARDALQVAAAHGYVEGLPFKILFEQMHALASVLASYAPTRHTDGE